MITLEKIWVFQPFTTNHKTTQQQKGLKPRRSKHRNASEEGPIEMHYKTFWQKKISKSNTEIHVRETL